MTLKVINNYLPEHDFKIVKNHVDSRENWTFGRKLNDNAKSEHDFQFGHEYIQNGESLYEGAERIPLALIMPYAQSLSTDLTILRARTNLFIRTRRFPFFRGMGYHKDMNDKTLFTLLFYLEDSNGGTQFKDSGKIIRSKRNRAIIFPAHWEHQTVAQTDTLFRTNININFR